jgi:uncharacterized protein (TIGR02453 family)
MPTRRTRPAPPSPAPFAGFRPQALRFLRALDRNNRKDWFEAHRATYETEIKAPLLAFIEEVDVQLGDLAPELVGTKRSMFRIHRDVRFSRDKRPYKTHASCWFYHRDAGRAVGENAAHGGAGFYFQFAPGQVMVGGGIWMPPRPALTRIREAIAEAPDAFAALCTAPAVTRRFSGLEREQMLTRMPRGYAPDHPAGEWLRFQSFTLGRPLPDTAIGSARLVSAVMRDYALMLPLVRWLNAVSGLRAATQR